MTWILFAWLVFPQGGEVTVVEHFPTYEACMAEAANVFPDIQPGSLFNIKCFEGTGNDLP